MASSHKLCFIVQQGIGVEESDFKRDTLLHYTMRRIILNAGKIEQNTRFVPFRRMDVEPPNRGQAKKKAPRDQSLWTLSS